MLTDLPMCLGLWMRRRQKMKCNEHCIKRVFLYQSLKLEKNMFKNGWN